jgi:hypothetical protein
VPVGKVAAVGESGVRVMPFTDPDRLEFVQLMDFGLGGILDEERMALDAEADAEAEAAAAVAPAAAMGASEVAETPAVVPAPEPAPEAAPAAQ